VFRLSRRLLLLIVFAIALASGLLYLAFRTPPAQASPLCANFFLQQEVEAWKRAQTLQMAQAAGITWAKQQFAWEEAEPRKGVFNWSKFDALVSLYAKYNLQVIARLDRPPDWTHKDPHFKQGPPDNLNDFPESTDNDVKDRRISRE
jgi:beta-galactosidase GanA